MFLTPPCDSSANQPRKTSQSASQLNRKLSAAQRLPLPSEYRDKPLSAVGSRDKNAPLHLALWALVAQNERGLIATHGEVVHGEMAEQVRDVVKHQSQSLRVCLVSQQDPVQISDSPCLTEPVALPAGTKDSLQLH